MPSVIAALDQGTTSTRCLLITEDGEVLATSQREHEQIYPRPGWVEHDPAEIWQATEEVIRGALASSGVASSEVAAVGVTNQRETVVVWDRATGRPYANAIVWQDTRTNELCRELSGESGQDRYREVTGLPLATYFSGPKIRWLLDNVDGLRDAARRGDALFGNIDTWLMWNLTGGPSSGVHVTDVTNASRTLLMSLSDLEWHEGILDEMGIPRSMLPEIRPSSDPLFYGKTTASGPFGAAIPVCGDLGDQQAALCGQTCFEPGEAKNTYGTGCFLLMNTGVEPIPSRSGLLTTVGYQFGNEPAVYALEGSIAIAGALVQWLRDNLGILGSSSEVETLARSVNDNGGAYLVPAFSGLFAPHWRSDARGVLVGLTRFVNKAHIARASLEATAFQTREVIEAMRTDSDIELKTLRVDGGMVANELLMQFQSDLLDVPVVRPAIAETTSLGAAYAAGLAVGVWRDLSELRKKWREHARWTPSMDANERNRLYSEWKKAVTRTLDWV